MVKNKKKTFAKRPTFFGIPNIGFLDFKRLQEKNKYVFFVSQYIKKISLLCRLQAQTLPDASQQIGKIHTLSKIAITLMPFRIQNYTKIVYFMTKSTISNRLGLTGCLTVTVTVSLSHCDCDCDCDCDCEWDGVSHCASYM